MTSKMSVFSFFLGSRDNSDTESKPRKKKRLQAGPVSIGFLAIAALFSFTASLWVPQDPGFQDLFFRLVTPFTAGDTTTYLLGTDQLGRDVFSRLVHGGKVSFAVGLATATFAMLIGGFLGLIAAYFRGWQEALILRIVDIQTAFPFLIVAIAIVSIVGAGVDTIIVTLVVWLWTPFARLAHAKSLSVKESEFYRAAISSGRSGFGLVFQHIVPNITGSMMVVWTFVVAQTIIAESSMSYLGLGVPLSTPTWGSMLSEGRNYLETAWWIATFPALAIMLTVLCVNVFGDWLSDRLDPQTKEI
jgi:peptide/nickel transport system permease protein